MNQAILLIVVAILGALAGKLAELIFEWSVKSRRSRKSPVIMKASDITAWGWDGKQLLKELIRLDRKVLGKELTSEPREGTVSQWAPVFMRHPDGWAILSIEKRIVGYFSFFALDDAFYEKAERGELLDSEITINNTIPFDVPGLYKAYFVLLAVLPEFPGAGRQLLEPFFDQLKSLAEKGVLFEQFLANAFTPDGKRICEGFGMEKICNHADFGEVYRLRLNPWPSRLDYKRWTEIKNLYEQGFPSIASAKKTKIETKEPTTHKAKMLTKASNKRVHPIA